VRFVFVFVLAFTSFLGLARATCPVDATLDTDMSAASADDVITLTGVSSVPGCPEVSMSESWSGGKLIVSDSPESPTSTGKLYEDATLGATSGTAYNRIFSYHVNNTGGTKRMAVLVKNRSGSSCTLTVQKAGRAGPTTSFLYAGKLAYNRWDTSSAGSGVSVAAGAWQDLDTTFSGQNVSNGNLYHGIWDYSFPCDHTVVTCIRSTSDAVSWCQTASVLTRDSHDRGTFDSTDKTYDTVGTFLTSEDIQQFPMASGTTNDAWITGYDNAVASPTAETLEGNYGVLYKLHLTGSDDDGRHAGFCINPRGGAWGGAAFAAVGLTPASGANHFLMPATTGSESSNTKCVVWGRYDLAAAPSTTTPWLQWMPTGGAAFPVRAVIVPH
jgi:hypothetical protein